MLHKTFLVLEPCSCTLASNVQLSCHNVQSFEYAFLLYQNNRCIELHSAKNDIQSHYTVTLIICHFFSIKDVIKQGNLIGAGREGSIFFFLFQICQYLRQSLFHKTFTFSLHIALQLAPVTKISFPGKLKYSGQSLRPCTFAITLYEVK